MYLALKRHFTSESYDYFKYNGKLRVTKDTYYKRKDRFFFEKMAKQYYSHVIQEIFVSNMIDDSNYWIGNTFKGHCMSVHKKWTTTIESLFYFFQQDFEKLIDEYDGDKFTNAFKCVDGQHPFIFKLYIQNKIMLETVIISNHFLKLFDRWKISSNDPILLPNQIVKMTKYSPFLIKYIDEGQFGVYIKKKIIDNK